MLWARTSAGWVALDPERREPREGLIAYNPRRQTGRALLPGEIEDAWRWAYAGATFHALHVDVCAAAGRRTRSRCRPGQEALALADVAPARESAIGYGGER
jgi:hypothetical protein